MKLRKLVIALCAVPLLAIAASNEADPGAALRALDWHVGPRAEQVVGKATLQTPDADTLFLDEANSTQFLKLTGNLPEPGNNIVLSRKGDWWADFSFNASGYVKDDDKIDADELLKTLKSGDGPANEERKRLGLAPLYTEGWYIPPHYDPVTKRLEWGLKLHSQGQTVLNYTIRLLGRTGVMSATLVSSPETFDADVASFKETLTGFSFNPGERYSEFKPGDRVAEFGLAALIAGGAAAVATKKGFWAVIGGFLAAGWKLVVGAVIAAFAGLRSFFKKKED
ncbi:MAG: DUF2167 domain-containing protein [Nitrospira sp.]|nr:DUF2167 domain-containing protein [Nitrospira sp.]